MDSEITRLRAEVAALAAEVSRLRRPADLPGAGPAPVGDGSDSRTSRRGLLRAAGVAAAAGLGARTLLPSSAQAADGASVQLGRSSATSGTPNRAESATEIAYDGGATPPSTLFLVNDTSYVADQPRYYNSVLAGWAGGHDSLNVGLYGLSETATNPIGLVGRGDNLDPDSPAGIGVEGTGVTGVHAVGTQYGVHAEGGQAPLLLEPGGVPGPPPAGTYAVGSVYADSDGALWLRKASGSSSVWVRVGFNGLVPARVYDSRKVGGAVRAGTPRTIVVATLGGVPALPAPAAVALAVTVITPTTSGYVTVYPAGSARPLVSNLNYRKDITGNALTTVKLGTGGAVSVSVAAGSAHIAVDVLGFFS